MDTRTALLEAAEDVCRQYGYDGFSYGDLAKIVGIRKASIHHHFPTKAELVEALIAHYQDGVMARLDQITQKNQRASQQCEAYLIFTQELLSEGQKLCLGVTLSLSPGRLSEAAATRLNAFHAAMLGWLHKLFSLAEKDGSIRDLAPAQLEAVSALALVQGAQTLSRSVGDLALFDISVRPLRQRFNPS